MSRLDLTLLSAGLECNEYYLLSSIMKKEFSQDIDDIRGNRRKMCIPPQRKP